MKSILGFSFVLFASSAFAGNENVLTHTICVGDTVRIFGQYFKHAPIPNGLTIISDSEPTIRNQSVRIMPLHDLAVPNLEIAEIASRNALSNQHVPKPKCDQSEDESTSVTCETSNTCASCTKTVSCIPYEKYQQP